VCSGCVNDYALKTVIDECATDEDFCDFCGGNPAAELDCLIGAFVDGLQTEFVDASDEGVFYDGAEGGYMWDETWDSWDLVTVRRRPDWGRSPRCGPRCR
jgi:hypothetical protein